MNVPKPVRKVDFKGIAGIKRMACIACGRIGVDAAHIKSRGAGGSDTPDNLIPLCRGHHIMQHRTGWLEFCETFPTVLQYLKQKGFYFKEFKLQK